MRKSIIFLTMAGLIGLLSYCKKDETKAVLSANPVVPTLTVPTLTLVRANGTDTVAFTGTPVNPGFISSATYYLEADTAGNKFQNAVVLVNDVQDAIFKFSVSDLNGLLIKRFPTDTVSSVDLRIRSVLVDDASAPAGVSLVSYSATKTVSVTTYGLPRLDLLGSGITQKIESPLGDGNYSSYVKLDVASPDDDQMFRQFIQLHDAGGIRRNRIQAFQIGDLRMSAGIDNDFWCAHFSFVAVIQSHLNILRPAKFCQTVNQFHPGFFYPPFPAVSKIFNNSIFSLADFPISTPKLSLFTPKSALR